MDALTNQGFPAQAEAFMDTGQGLDIGLIRAIMRRRKWGFLLTFLIIFALAAAIALVLPPIFLSKATILIENQLIPPEYVQTTITGFVEERLQVINQQIMSRSRLLDIITRFDLYKEMREKYTVEEVIEEMRDDIRYNTISANVLDRRTGRPMEATIAFTLSYEGRNPSVVQKVANVLASLYMELNLQAREQRATTTTDFLQQELNDLAGQTETLQSRISEFKQAHTGELPEYVNTNLQMIGRLERDLDQVYLQLGSLRERKVLLQSQLANVDPLMPVVDEQGKQVMNPRDRLKYLRLQLLTLQGSLSAKHPDVKRLKREVEELEAEVGETDDSMEKLRRLEELEAELAAVQGDLGPKHPDVIRLTREVEVLRVEVEGLGARRKTLELAAERPDNPTYINLQTQVDATDLEIERLMEAETRIKAQIAEYEGKVQKAPAVEREYSILLRDYENTRAKYNDISHKLMEARVAQGMEESQRGERFTIIDPPQVPERPHKPNRIAILLIGFVLGLFGGVGTAALRETLDGSVKSTDELSLLTGVPVLSVIPRVVTDAERRRRRIRTLVVVLAVIGAIILTAFLIDRFVMPLEVFWAKVERKLGKFMVI